MKKKTKETSKKEKNFICGLFAAKRNNTIKKRFNEEKDETKKKAISFVKSAKRLYPTLEDIKKINSILGLKFSLF